MAENNGTWSRFRRPRTNPATPPPTQAQQEAAAQPPQTATPPRSGTFIEMGAIFEGTLKLQGDFHIDNEFHGVLSTDGTVTVGPNGAIEGDIIARQVEIEGAVVGNVNARRMFVLRASGKLHGDIETACLHIEPHAFFQGGTKMVQPLAEAASREANERPVATPAP